MFASALGDISSVFSPTRHKGFNIFTEWSFLRPAFTHTHTQTSQIHSCRWNNDRFNFTKTNGILVSWGGLGGGCKRERERERERTVVSESLLVIGFSHWSKLFFSFLLFSGLSFAAWKINPKRSSWAAGLVHSSRALWANFPAQRANSEREGERGGQWEREREREMMMKAIYESSCCWVSTLLVCVNVCVCVCALLRCLSGRCGMKSTQKHSLYCTCTCPRI